ncbi:dihydroorotate dehydrogenase electron transfer subunit [Allorhodopirellula solitaria]|uniref:Dihydroorotate dehydrogenase B (NAD(+)), electron transfer subunit n=1 Tax=Allorhodopirellula solitaria TaxID=2527987 RepID=A0A5C5XVT6_9BACT|nr:dihydroorotate dehydrogenase electron transfer subunit [Allorhodopirellula solitaria]TWT67437.1 Dihydroorotate dehydrogenase B (NAD(+)), electron transfer subunit [Allorhodopirellula solitaria]
MATLHAKHYADAISHLDAPLLLNEQVAENTYLMRVRAPAIAATAKPGQFVMIRLAGLDAPLIGRAFAIYDVHPDPESNAADSVDLIYLRKGALTRPLSEAPVGTMVSLWGPLGNAFRDDPCERLIMAVGGIGQTPMLMAGRDALQRGWADHVEMIYGARRSSLLAGVSDFRDAGFAVTTCTDDGSEGRQALVPDVLAERIQTLQQESPDAKIRVLTCGPEIMMEKVAEVGAAQGVDVQVSMETPMACGIGICFSCVAKVIQEDGEWDYKRTCVDGPIFDAEQLCWG